MSCSSKFAPKGVMLTPKSYSQGSDLLYNIPQTIINVTTNTSTFKVASLAADAMNR